MTTTTKAVEFKVGDKVTVTAPTMGNYGKTGTITSLESGYKAWPINVKFDDGDDANYAASELALVEPPFAFADIQVGDTIRRTQTFKGGATEVREGTVSRKASWYVEQDGYLLAYDSDDAAEDTTLELLNRPEPEPVKAVWEDAKTGDRLVVKGVDGTTRVMTKQEDGLWDALLVHAHRASGKGFKRDDKELRICLTEDDHFAEGGKYEFFPAS